MPARESRTLSLPVVVAIALPLLLAVGVASLGIASRANQDEPAAPVADTAPLAVAPVDAPDAAGPDCAAVLAAVDGDLPAGDTTLPVRTLADPVPPGVRAWVAAPRPVVLRCGLPRPAELTPTSPLVEVDGVSWLELDDGVPNPTVISYVAVDRPVYVVLTVPTGLGNGPLTLVSDAVGGILAEVPVVVR